MQSMTINTATTKTVVSNRSRALNIALWVLQVLLAAVYVAHGWLLVSPPGRPRWRHHSCDWLHYCPPAGTHQWIEKRTRYCAE